MKRNRVDKICLQCGTSFEVVYSRRDTANYCSRKCYHDSTKGNPTWNSGLTYEEMYGENAEKMKQIVARTGEENGMYGKRHSRKAKAKMREAKVGIESHSKGKKYPNRFAHLDRTGENNAYIKYILRTEGITYDEYLERQSDRDKYYNEVRRITKLQPIHILENYEKRGKSGDPDAYHLDHIYPISMGFHNGIPPEKIGDISNLQFIHWRDNLIKSNKV